MEVFLHFVLFLCLLKIFLILLLQYQIVLALLPKQFDIFDLIFLLKFQQLLHLFFVLLDFLQILKQLVIFQIILIHLVFCFFAHLKILFFEFLLVFL